jgi:hypothetical protein
MRTLLIALGCSWTEGMGIYTEGQVKYWDGALRRDNWPLELMAQYSWPSQVARAKNWQVKNLGWSGGSNSGAAKRLIMANMATDQWDCVKVVWMLSGSNRFSFYKHDQIKDYNLGTKTTHPELLRAYVAEVSTDQGERLETEFYLKTVYHYCRSRGWEFNYWTCWEQYWCAHVIEGVPREHNLALKLNKHTAKTVVRLAHEERGGMFAPCEHPNQKGYTEIADKLIKVL